MKEINGLCNIRKLHGKGNHLIVDGFSKDSKILDSVIFIEEFLINLTKKIGMKSISKPLVVNYKSSGEDNSQDGITGTILLADSNITIHTYPSFGFFCLDIFSCNEFDIDLTIKDLVKVLKIEKYTSKLLKRGFYGKD